jgi:hypothetical protein
VRWLDDLQRVATSAENAYAARLGRARADSRHLLAGLDLPTLVLHSRGDQVTAFKKGRYLAATILGARFAAIRGADAGRVLVLASGGLSHWLPSHDPRDPTVAGEQREALIHGRLDTHAFAAAREPRVRAMGGNPKRAGERGWDQWFLYRLGFSDLSAVTAPGHQGLEEVAGTGGHEIRTWLIGPAAVGAPVVWMSYDPVPEWITGMGIATTFPVD